MAQDVVKIRVNRNGRDVILFFYESKNGGDNWVYNGRLTFDPDIGIWVLEAIQRGRSGGAELIVEEYGA